jgi:hypothetical protein
MSDGGTTVAHFARTKSVIWFIFRTTRSPKNEPQALLNMQAKRATKGRFMFYKKTLERLLSSYNFLQLTPIFASHLRARTFNSFYT